MLKDPLHPICCEKSGKSLTIAWIGVRPPMVQIPECSKHRTQHNTHVSKRFNLL